MTEGKKPKIYVGKDNKPLNIEDIKDPTGGKPLDTASLLGIDTEDKKALYMKYRELIAEEKEIINEISVSFPKETLDAIKEAISAAHEVLSTAIAYGSIPLEPNEEEQQDGQTTDNSEAETPENLKKKAEYLSKELYKKTDHLSMLLAPYATGFFKGDLEPFTDEKGQLAYKKTVEVRNRKNNQIARVDLKLLPSDIKEGVYIERPLDPFDNSIMDALHSIYESGARRFTPQNVYEKLSNKTTKNKTMLNDIRDRIMKLDDTRVSIRLDELEKVYGKEKEGEPERPQRIFNSRIINVDNFRWKDEYNKSTWQDGFVFLKEPTLSMVCKAYNNQMVTVNAKYLTYAFEAVSTTSTTIPLANTLLKRILQLKNLNSNRILLDSIYKDLDIDTSDRRGLTRIRNSMFLMLDSFKNTKKEERLFKDYKVVNKCKKIYAIDFIF